MELNERIAKIKEYFITLKVEAEDDAILVGVHFPDSWRLPNQQAIRDNYKVQIGPGANCMFFGTEIANGTDTIFDAIESVIEFNKEIEEKEGLLREKISELTEMFATEPISRLRSLRLIITDEPIEMVEEEPIVKKESKKEESEVPEKKEKSSDKKEKTSKKEAKNNDAEDNSLMAFAKTLVGE